MFQKDHKYKIRKILKKSLLAIGLILVCGIFTKYNNHLYNGVIANLFEGFSTQNFLAHAQDPTTQSSFQSARDSLTTVTKVFTEVLFMLIYPIIAIIGKLLSNEWVFSDPQLQNVIQALWIIVRNFVNIIFAIVLVGIAFISVSGLSSTDEGKNYAIQTTVPRIILGIILVNFSLFFAKFMIDLGAITTNAIVSIPGTVVPADKFFEGTVTQIREDQSKDSRMVSLWRTKFMLSKSEAQKIGLDTANYDEMNKLYSNGTNTGAEANKEGYNPFVRYKCKVPKAWIIHFNKKSIATRIFEDEENKDLQNAYGIVDLKDGSIVTEDKLYGENGISYYTGDEVGDDDYDRLCVNSMSDLMLSPKNIAFLIASQTINVPSLIDGVTTENFDTLTINILFSFLFLLVAFITFVVMLVALAVRTIMLWIMLIISPVWVAIATLPGGIKGSIESGMSSVSVGAFLGLVFMPTLMVAPLVIAYILGTYTITFGTGVQESLEGIQLGGVTIFISNLRVAGYDSIYHIFVAVLALASMWIGVKFAVNNKGIVSDMAKPVIDFGDQALSYLAKSPLYAPIPYPGGTEGTGPISLAGLASVSDIAKQMESSRSEEAKEAFNLKFGLPGEMTKNVKALQEVDGNITKLTSAIGRLTKTQLEKPQNVTTVVSQLKTEYDKNESYYQREDSTAARFMKEIINAPDVETQRKGIIKLQDHLNSKNTPKSPTPPTSPQATGNGT